MNKVLGSTKDLFDLDNPEIKEFVEIIIDILDNHEYQKLDNYDQHLHTSRLQHCLNVAYYTYKIAKPMNIDYVSAVRAAMLHDFYLYDWQTEQPINGRHSDVHSIVALINAEKYFDVNEVMEDCILNHMWPFSANSPKTAEGWVVQSADKYCCAIEFGSQSIKKALPVFESLLK